MNVIEWCRQHDIWYLKMDLQIPEACIKEAQQVYDEGYFVEHRYGDGDGWCSAALHGWVGEEEKDTEKKTNKISGSDITAANIRAHQGGWG